MDNSSLVKNIVVKIYFNHQEVDIKLCEDYRLELCVNRKSISIMAIYIQLVILGTFYIHSRRSR